MHARSPEELETLLEDALVLQDEEAVAALFEDGGVLVAGQGCVRERARAAQLLVQHTFHAAPSSVTVVGNVAVVVGPQTVNISHHADRQGWLLLAVVVLPRARMPPDNVASMRRDPW